MADFPWFKFYGETINDIKFMKIAREEQLSFTDVVGVWTILLCLASNSPHRGALYITKDVPYTIDDLVEILHFDSSTIAYLLDNFKSLDMIYLASDFDDEAPETIIISHWDERQQTKEEKVAADNARRQREFRERHKNDSFSINEDNKSNVTDNVTNNNDVTRFSSSISDSISSSDSLTTLNSLKQPNIFQIYEREIGVITRTISEELKDAEKEYPPDWVDEAVKIAVAANKRQWNYIRGILKKWKAQGFKSNGFSPGSNGNKSNSHSPADFADYIKQHPEEYGDIDDLPDS